MILAQALGEYATASVLWEALLAFRVRLEDAFYSLEPTHYAFALLTAAVVWRLMGRRA
jgi:hypothetical protein